MTAQQIKTGNTISDNWDTYTVLSVERRGSTVIVAVALRGRFYSRFTYLADQEIYGVNA